GIAAPTPLGVDRRSFKQPSGAGELAPQVYAEEVLQVEAAITAQWQEYTQKLRMTFSTLVQAAWALILSRYSRQADVVFGNVVAGRPPELAGVEDMVGLFINTVPVRVQVKDEAEVESWLMQLQEQQLEQYPYDYSSLVQVQGWSEVPRDHPLFE